MQRNRFKFGRLASEVIVVSVVTAAVLLHSAYLRAQQQRAYTGNENHVITLAEAVQYIQNFKDNPTLPNIRGGYFGKNIFNRILSQEGCVGIRYYYAQSDSITSTIVLVGVDSTGNDMTQGVIAENPLPCPPGALRPMNSTSKGVKCQCQS